MGQCNDIKASPPHFPFIHSFTMDSPIPSDPIHVSDILQDNGTVMAFVLYVLSGLCEDIGHPHERIDTLANDVGLSPIDPMSDCTAIYPIDPIPDPLKNLLCSA
jgi:hypothetical protein